MFTLNCSFAVSESDKILRGSIVPCIYAQLSRSTPGKNEALSGKTITCSIYYLPGTIRPACDTLNQVQDKPPKQTNRADARI